MKYFILYVFGRDLILKEFYLKGKSFKHMEDRIRHYSNGSIFTSKFCITTANNYLGFLREIDLEFHPELKKTDFAMINENYSYRISELGEE